MAGPVARIDHHLGMVVVHLGRMDMRQWRGSVDHLRLDMVEDLALADEPAVLYILHLPAFAHTGTALAGLF